MSTTVILTVCVATLAALLSFSLYKLLRFSMILINLEDTIEDCLRILDEKHTSMSDVLEIPVFFDSLEVRRVINDINASRESLVVVANKLTQAYGREIEIKEEEDNNQG